MRLSLRLLLVPLSWNLLLHVAANTINNEQHVFQSEPGNINVDANTTLSHLIDSLDVLQSKFFSLDYGIYPSAIDWTSAVTQTHLTSTLHSLLRLNRPTTTHAVYRYFTHLVSFFQQQDVFALRFQATDDKLWVCLGWLSALRLLQGLPSYYQEWSEPFASRALEFYELTLDAWDETTCGGGMIWNTKLTPYKNAITNELFVAASIGMYLHHPESSPVYLHNAQKAYGWLRSIEMMNSQGLFVDGFHITQATGKCDIRTEDVWTYNQGVILSALSGLYEATGEEIYLVDAVDLITAVMNSGYTKDGILEEVCERNGDCSQDGQTFKGIFWYYMGYFCKNHPTRCGKFHGFLEGNANAAWRARDGNGVFGSWWGTYREKDAQGAYMEQPHSEVADGKKGYLDRDEWMNNGGSQDPNERGRGRTLESHTGGLAVIRAAWEVLGK